MDEPPPDSLGRPPQTMSTELPSEEEFFAELAARSRDQSTFAKKIPTCRCFKFSGLKSLIFHPARVKRSSSRNAVSQDHVLRAPVQSLGPRHLN